MIVRKSLPYQGFSALDIDSQHEGIKPGELFVIGGYTKYTNASISHRYFNVIDRVKETICPIKDFDYEKHLNYRFGFNAYLSIISKSEPITIIKGRSVGFTTMATAYEKQLRGMTEFYCHIDNPWEFYDLSPLKMPPHCKCEDCKRGYPMSIAL